jgi:hypothetical protein
MARRHSGYAGYDEDLSREVSTFLRHGAARKRVTVRPDGLVRVEDVLAHMACKKSDLELLRDASMNRGQHRFQMVQHSSGEYIRAMHKHTMSFIDPSLLVVDPIECLNRLPPSMVSHDEFRREGSGGHRHGRRERQPEPFAAAHPAGYSPVTTAPPPVFVPFSAAPPPSSPPPPGHPPGTTAAQPVHYAAGPPPAGGALVSKAPPSALAPKAPPSGLQRPMAKARPPELADVLAIEHEKEAREARATEQELVKRNCQLEERVARLEKMLASKNGPADNVSPKRFDLSHGAH